MIARGEIYWADLGTSAGSRPAKLRPVLVVSSDHRNRSAIATVVVVAVTSRTDRAVIPGNTFLPAATTGLPRDSVVNVSSLATVNKYDLLDRAGFVAGDLLQEVEAGLRQILAL